MEMKNQIPARLRLQVASSMDQKIKLLHVFCGDSYLFKENKRNYFSAFKESPPKALLISLFTGPICSRVYLEICQVPY